MHRLDRPLVFHETMGQPIEQLMPTRLRHHHPAHRTRYMAAPYARPMGGGADLVGRFDEVAASQALVALITDRFGEGE